MTLSEFLRDHHLSASAFAKQVGVTPEAIRKYLNCNRIPRSAILAKIISATEGQVQPNDFFMPGVPEKPKKPAKRRKDAEAH